MDHRFGTRQAPSSTTMNVSSLPTPQAVLHFIERTKRPLSAYNLFFQDERQKLLLSGRSPSSISRQNRICQIGQNHCCQSIQCRRSTLTTTWPHKRSSVAKTPCPNGKVKEQRKSVKMTSPQSEEVPIPVTYRSIVSAATKYHEPRSLSKASSGCKVNNDTEKEMGSSYMTELCAPVPTEEAAAMSPSCHEPILFREAVLQQAQPPVSHDFSSCSHVVSSTTTMGQHQQLLPSVNNMSVLSPISVMMLNQRIDNLVHTLEEDSVDWLVDVFHKS
jgi:hypothetical protein